MARQANILSFDEARRKARTPRVRSTSARVSARPSVSSARTTRSTKAVKPTKANATAKAVKPTKASASNKATKASASNKATKAAKATKAQSRATSGILATSTQSQARPSRRSSTKASRYDTSKAVAQERNRVPRETSRKTKWSPDNEAVREDEQTSQTSRAAKREAKREAKRKARAKSKAERSFAKQFGSTSSASSSASSAAAEDAQAAPRAAVYKGQMGTTHKKAARMQNSTGTSQVLKRGFSLAEGATSLAAKPKFIALASIVVCLVLSVLFLYPSAQQYYQAVREHDRLQAEYAVIAERNASIDHDVNTLQTDSGIEDRAHEQLGWVKAGESTASVRGLETGEEDTSVRANIPPGSIPAPETWYSPVLDTLFAYESA